MGTIKVILKEDIPNLGEAGDIKVVKRGYARNFLFPKKLVVDYSKNNRKMLETKKDYYENKKLEKKDNALKLKEKLEQELISITVSAGEKGRLFGTVTNSNIAERLAELNYNIDKKSIEIKEHIKYSGKYKFRIHLYQDIYANMELEIIGKIEKPKTAQRPQRRSRKRYSPPDKPTKIEKPEESGENVKAQEKESVNQE